MEKNILEKPREKSRKSPSRNDIRIFGENDGLGGSAEEGSTIADFLT